MEMEAALSVKLKRLERPKVPTLIVSAEDDLWKTLPGAPFAAEHIRGPELRVLESGGHLMVGQNKLVSKWATEFLRRHRVETKPSERKHDRTVRQVLEPVV